MPRGTNSRVIYEFETFHGFLSSSSGTKRENFKSLCCSASQFFIYVDILCMSRELYVVPFQFIHLRVTIDRETCLLGT